MINLQALDNSDLCVASVRLPCECTSSYPATTDYCYHNSKKKTWLSS